ncbi:MAG: ParB/RepB/Spo0J family partition protein [Acidimicrobiaceae bacterium]|nr:ParB/RepB/Spo0J family partition protein [Acidimicrobiaceae bacterium]
MSDRRSGLGRGLSALIPVGEMGAPKSALRELPIGQIRPNPMQPRRYFDEESLSHLAASISSLGLLQPILVRRFADQEYQIIAGERRWRAARRAGLDMIPALVQDADDLSSLEQAVVENLHREDLNPLEEAGAYRQLIDDFGLTHDQLAQRMGKSRTAITNSLRLFQLPQRIQEYLAEGSITAGHARAILGSSDRNFQEELAERIKKDQLSVRQAEEAVKGLKSVPEVSEQAEADKAVRTHKLAEVKAPWILELEGLVGELLSTRVKVELAKVSDPSKEQAGRISVEFGSLDDLERIFRLLVGETFS